ncbi:MAG TPA: hypothetical protein VGC72_04055 [Candidatus Elarobacter sp.]|jgi:hypothetical protein
MFALDAVSRSLFACAAFVAFGAAFVTTPIVARGEPGTIAQSSQPLASAPGPTALADVIPRRDPFAAGDTPVARANATPAQTSITSPTIATLPEVPAALRALPPNAGAGAEAFPFASGARTAATVTAVVTGPHPFALVDEAGATRVLTVGDRIDGEAIAAIGTGGVRLSNGTMLPVEPASGIAGSSHSVPARAAPVPSTPGHAGVQLPATITAHPLSGGR